jgi:hypothetical protein|tara:strand:+ start:2559 stop:2813 length:255 start_codon:yes stop_codon:yes gene_type:complete
MAAGEKEMNALHKALAEAYAKGLKEDTSPAMLSSASKFLKDNLVVMVPESTDALDEVAEAFKDRNFEEPEDKKVLSFPSKAKEA